MIRRIYAIPVDLVEANAFVDTHHRHHKPVVGHKFSIGAVLDEKIVGVVIVGRPVSRRRDDGMTLEVRGFARTARATPARFFTEPPLGPRSHWVTAGSGRTF